MRPDVSHRYEYLKQRTAKRKPKPRDVYVDLRNLQIEMFTRFNGLEAHANMTRAMEKRTRRSLWAR